MDDADSSAADALIDGMVPTPARKKAAREDALSKALNLGEYPEYRGLHGVVDELDPKYCHCMFTIFKTFVAFVLSHHHHNIYPKDTLAIVALLFVVLLYLEVNPLNNKLL